MLLKAFAHHALMSAADWDVAPHSVASAMKGGSMRLSPDGSLLREVVRALHTNGFRACGLRARVVCASC